MHCMNRSLKRELNKNDNCDNFRLFIINHYNYAVKINVVIKELNNNFFFTLCRFLIHNIHVDYILYEQLTMSNTNYSLQHELLGTGFF